MFKFTIPLEPKTKKNSVQIMKNRKTGNPFVAQSSAYREYQEQCGWFIPKPQKPIDGKVNIKAIYFMSTRRKVDITNLHSALHDVLTHYGVIADDSADIVLATDGSRVKYDKDSPRTEVEITALNELSYKENKEVKKWLKRIM